MDRVFWCFHFNSWFIKLQIRVFILFKGKMIRILLTYAECIVLTKRNLRNQKLSLIFEKWKQKIGTNWRDLRLFELFLIWSMYGFIKSYFLHFDNFSFISYFKTLLEIIPKINAFSQHCALFFPSILSIGYINKYMHSSYTFIALKSIFLFMENCISIKNNLYIKMESNSLREYLYFWFYCQYANLCQKFFLMSHM